MTVIQNLVKASAAFVKIAPATLPTNPTPELLDAFRRYRYWELRWYGLGSSPASVGAYNSTRDLAMQCVESREWDAHRANSRHWADRPARLAAAILAASPLTPAEATAAAHALDGVTR